VAGPTSGAGASEPLWRRALALPAGRRAKWVLVALWLVVTALTGPFAGKLPGVEKNDAVNYLPASAQSTKVNDALAYFPGGQQVPGIVLYVATGGRITAADRAVAASQVASAARQVPDFTPGAATVSQDGKAIAYAFNVTQPDATKLSGDIEKVRSAASGSPAVTSYVTGAAGLLVDSVRAFSGIDGLLLIVTGIVVIVLLLLIYRSPTLWLVPLLSVAGAVGISEWAVYQLAARAGLVVSGQNGGILTVLVFGAGTDYALLLVARYREELRRHEDHHDAMRAALHRASPVILASASTVILGLLCLLAAELNSESGLGPIGAIGIASALLAQLTFLPALLTVFGRRLFWPARPGYRPEQAQAADGFWARTAVRISRRPRPIWTGTVVALLVLTAGLAGLNLGLRQTQSFVNTPQSVAGQRLYAQHFPAGGSEPVIIIADAAKTGPVVTAVRRVPNVTTAIPAATARGQVKVIAILSSAPDSAASYQAIDAMRSTLARIPGAHALVGGSVATTLDTDNAASADRWIVMPLVLLIVMCILAILLRAIVAPVLLALTVVLSFAASLGVSSLVFHALGFAGVDQTIPLLAFIFLVALGVDYNIFLVSRIREEALTRGTREGTVTAVRVTGGVITSAGVVLAATFSVLTVLPLVALVEVGFIVAFGVLLDTLVVRSVLVPALITDVGPAVWWPSALARRDRPR
jgi:RND superfamily putative drug exporter